MRIFRMFDLPDDFFSGYGHRQLNFIKIIIRIFLVRPFSSMGNNYWIFITNYANVREIFYVNTIII